MLALLIGAGAVVAIFFKSKGGPIDNSLPEEYCLSELDWKNSRLDLKAS
jgi:hypothetical protein